MWGKEYSARVAERVILKIREHYISMKDYGNIYSLRVLCTYVLHKITPGTFIKKGSQFFDFSVIFNLE